MIPNNKISIVIPFLNEEENIPELLSQIRELNDNYKQLIFEFVFVDDGSTDNSLQLLKAGLTKDLQWKIVKLSRNYGSYNALRVGVTNATYDIVSFLYADLQDPTWLIPSMYKKMQEGHTIVVAERKSTKYKFRDRFFSELHAKIIRRFVSEAFPERGFDVVMFNESIKDRLNQNIEADSNIFMQIIKSGFSQGRIYYDKVDRKHGTSKWSFGNKIKASLDVLISFSYFPVRLISFSGLIFTFLAGSWLILFLILSVSGHAPGLILSVLLFILLAGFGITLFSLAILGEYLWRILNAARKRPAFTIDEIIIPQEKATNNGDQSN